MCHLQADTIKSQPSFLLHPFLVCYVLRKTWNIWPQGEIGSGLHTRIHKSWLNLTRIHKSWLNLNHYRSEFYYHILTAMGSVLLSDNSLHNGLFVWHPGSSKGEHTPSLDEACHRPANEGAQMLGTGVVRDEWQVPQKHLKTKALATAAQWPFSATRGGLLLCQRFAGWSFCCLAVLYPYGGLSSSVLGMRRTLLSEVLRAAFMSWIKSCFWNVMNAHFSKGLTLWLLLTRSDGM